MGNRAAPTDAGGGRNCMLTDFPRLLSIPTTDASTDTTEQYLLTPKNRSGQSRHNHVQHVPELRAQFSLVKTLYMRSIHKEYRPK